ncbi:hypothetical protein P7D22_20095 [Lichenihabitans sp. Uapishka_5]|uniref:hypothetical protein n=1 Tax=Lichenihabitans sp. Uapishka_5 TaxID=3037302 RepID=UPI0029E7D89A|nr:hypothetical protein [Lichenihabitans sp. Uapishka_5]MDX7953470.1 hypothetical protein [Lichenihabitans sp. Uapishka_5]
MNNAITTELTPPVSAALTGWLALTNHERRTLQAAMAALQSLGQSSALASQPAFNAVPSAPATTLSIDTLPAVDLELFRSEAYRALGQGETIAFYIAGCRGLLGLSQPLGIPIYKAGFSRGLTIETRLAHLRQSAYAGVWKSGAEHKVEAGFDSWEATVLRLEHPRPAGSPVRSLPQALAITLPAGVDPLDIDRVLMQALAPRSLQHFVTGDAGQAHCGACAVDPARLRRFTARDTKRGRKFPESKELFRLAPRQDTEALAQLIEAVVADAASTLLRR